MKKLLITQALLLFIIIISVPAAAVDVAPRISDREIVESLAEIKAKQKVLEDKMDQRFTAMGQRFTAMQEQMDLRFTSMDLRFSAMQEQIDQRFTSMDQRFTDVQEQMDKRFEFFQQLMIVLIAGVFGLIGFIIWDRYSTLRPMDMRLRRIEEDLENDLELKSPEGSRITRMIHALRELAKEDKKVAAVLRSFSLL